MMNMASWMRRLGLPEGAAGVAFAALLLGVGAGPAAAQATDGTRDAAAAQGVDGAQPAPVTRPEAFTVRRGDVLHVTVWPDTVLSGRYPIEGDGYVHLPVLGAVPAGNRTLERLRTDIRQRYGNELKSPVITVVPMFRVSVIGAVERPGLYEVSPTNTVFDAVSLAGGFRQEADADAIRVIHADGRVVEINAEDAIENGDAELALALRSGDRIVVPRQRFNFGLDAVVDALQAVGLLITFFN